MHATEIEVVAALERDVRLAKVRVLEQLGIDQPRHRRAQPRPDEVAKKLAGTKALFLVTTHVHPEHDLGAQAFPDTTTLIRSIDQVNEIAESGLQLAKVFASRPPINSLKMRQFYWNSSRQKNYLKCYIPRAMESFAKALP